MKAKVKGYKAAFKEVMRTYEADRDRAAHLLRQRQAEVYRQVPRVQEIDRQLAQQGILAARSLLAAGSFGGAEDSDALLAQFMQQSAEFRAEKAQILRENDIPENYFTDIYRCGTCADTGFLPDTPSERCACLKQKLIDKYYDLSNLQAVLQAENFDTFDLRYYSEQTAPEEGLSPHLNMQLVYRTAVHFVQGFGKPFQNLLFYGDTGLGKTFLCNCIAKDLLDQGHTVLYATAPQLFKVVEDARFGRDTVDEPDEALEAVTDVDLLILDDLGAEFATVVTSAALFNIINQRLLTQKPTVISTNLSPVELEAQYSDRIVSRFLGYYKMTKFFGSDIRAKKKYSKSAV